MYAFEGKLPEPSQVLRELGRLAAVDAVLNNFDRVPAAHTNEGNVDNYLISTDGHVFPVDQMAAAIKVESGQKVHADRVRALSREARGGVPGPACERVKTHFAAAGVRGFTLLFNVYSSQASAHNRLGAVYVSAVSPE